MELICYTFPNKSEFEIRPAPSRRDWMDGAHERAPYRCLPLVMANGYGWEILSPVSFTAIWNGGQHKEGLVVLEEPGTTAPATSHFGEGILTFRFPFLFRTDPGTDLLVQGPTNRPKDAIAPLTGLVEADWGPFSFTMNWRFTRAQTPVRFRAGEPFCCIVPVRRGVLETIQPEIRPITDDAMLNEKHTAWEAARRKFNEDLNVPGSEAQKLKWQKDYQRGIAPDGMAGPTLHRTKSSLKPFVREKG